MFLKSSVKSAAAVFRTWSVFSGSMSGKVTGAGAGRLYSNTHLSRPHGDTGTEKFINQSVRQYARAARKKEDFQSQLQDLSPSMLKHEYANVPLAHTVDDVVKKLLSLELASHSEKLRLKKEQLIAKVQKDENDHNSTEVKVAILTAQIRNFQEHLHKHPKDKANKRWMLMSIDRRNKILKVLRRTHYAAFERVCQELGITYTFPPEYYRRATRRWLAKKALCIKVFKEVQKQKAEQRSKMRQSLQAQKTEVTRTKSTDASGTAV
ncbi:small ribosomal subunit protein uS15m [Hoplias malabaricus]|uniref:small ribosomal subunit protein uS15m n=1 Tax=Hoplias malabaricus TaxID=27720 RepID=UPI00346230EB